MMKQNRTDERFNKLEPILKTFAEHALYWEVRKLWWRRMYYLERKLYNAHPTEAYRNAKWTSLRGMIRCHILASVNASTLIDYKCSDLVGR